MAHPIEWKPGNGRLPIYREIRYTGRATYLLGIVLAFSVVIASIVAIVLTVTKYPLIVIISIASLFVITIIVYEKNKRRQGSFNLKRWDIDVNEVQFQQKRSGETIEKWQELLTNYEGLALEFGECEVSGGEKLSDCWAISLKHTDPKKTVYLKILKEDSPRTFRKERNLCLISRKAMREIEHFAKLMQVRPVFNRYTDSNGNQREAEVKIK